MRKTSNNRRIDPCMVEIVKLIDSHPEIDVLACCCGHGKYNQTIVIEDINLEIIDLVSGQKIPRKKRFYLKDKAGYYYIPESKLYWQHRRIRK